MFLHQAANAHDVIDSSNVADYQNTIEPNPDGNDIIVGVGDIDSSNVAGVQDNQNVPDKENNQNVANVPVKEFQFKVPAPFKIRGRRQSTPPETTNDPKRFKSFKIQDRRLSTPPHIVFKE